MKNPKKKSKTTQKRKKNRLLRQDEKLRMENGPKHKMKCILPTLSGASGEETRRSPVDKKKKSKKKYPKQRKNEKKSPAAPG
jgi:hypothetical protein